ncbi:MAG: ribonuclease P protein component [Bacteroidota bacterium]|jgi:ribonuclease P protein component|nr:ribonuclease P protein component [Bacteroidota bacterium]HHU97804.1 ribonuclease P protein component [Petrimonas sp.]
MNDEKRFTFTKEERVTGKRRIETLFAQGNSFMAYPFRVIYLERVPYPLTLASILITVPKKRVRSAVQRNRVKRLAREAYRLNKHILNPIALREDKGIDIAFIYVKEGIADFTIVEKGVRKALNTLVAQLDNGIEKC